MPVEATNATFDSEVLETEGKVIVDFWAEWCGPCKQLTPALEKAAAAREGEVVLAKLDTDANQSLAAAFRIQGIPAVKAFKDGKVVSEFVGVQPPPAVERFFDELVPSEADRLVVAGQTRPQIVFEIMGRAGELSAEQIALRAHYSDGVAAYRARRWDEARRAFQAALEAVPGDGPSMAMAQRVENFRANPPPADWDGSWRLDQK